ncbi:MAG TPA: hypothetical protein VF945_19160 [Polyangia bacterium]
MVELLQRLFGVLGRLDLAVGALDLPVGADEVRDARRRLRAGVVRRAVGDADLLVGVAQERKVEAVLLRELPIRFDRIEADAEDLNVVLAELLGSITEPLAFDRSTRGVGHRVEPQQHALAAQIGQLHRLARVRLAREVGREIAFLEHEHLRAGI